MAASFCPRKSSSLLGSRIISWVILATCWFAYESTDWRKGELKRALSYEEQGSVYKNV